MIEIPKQYDKIICSQDVKEKLLTMVKPSNEFNYFGVPVYVSNVLPDNIMYLIEKDCVFPDFRGYAYSWHWTMSIETAIGECFYKCKNSLKELKEKLFKQLDNINR